MASRPGAVALPARARPASRAIRRLGETVAVGALLLASIVFLQARAGSFDSEFGAHPDESAHYVTGLMVRQYIASGQWGSPMRFAEDYYLHYPKVALGQWPPLFYAVQAGWTLPFTPSRHSVLLLMAVLTTALALTVFVSLRERCGLLPSLALALVLAASPLVQRASGMLMAEVLLALLCLWGALSFGRFLASGRGQDAAIFGALAVAALMCKGNALALALMVPLAVLFSRRFALALHPASWLPAVMVLVLCGPWYWLTAGMVHASFVSGRTPTLEYAMSAGGFYAWQLARTVGWGLTVLAALGAATTLAAPRGDERRHRSAVVAALVAAAWALHSLTPSSREPRHMVMAVAPLVMLAGFGLAWIDGRLGPSARRLRRAALAGVVVAVFALDTFGVPLKAWRGFSAVADGLLRELPAEGSRILVSADTRGEGMFISELARRQPQPRHLVLRASKVLVRMGWNGEDYQLLYDTPEEVARYLDDVGVDAVILDRSLLADATEPHHRILAQALAAHADRWAPLASFTLIRGGVEAPEALAVYKRLGRLMNPRIPLDPRDLLRGKDFLSERSGSRPD